MTYVPRRTVTDTIPNKFEAIRVLALECRRLNDELRQREEHTDRKISSMAIERLFDEHIRYYDARERREQERSEAMLSAAEGLLAGGPPEMMSEEMIEEAGEAGTDETVEQAAGKTDAPSS